MTDEVRITRRNTLLGATTLAASALGAGAPLRTAHAAELNPQPLPPSPNWARAMPPGPDASVKITNRRENEGSAS